MIKIINQWKTISKKDIHITPFTFEINRYYDIWTIKIGLLGIIIMFIKD